MGCFRVSTLQGTDQPPGSKRARFGMTWVQITRVFLFYDLQEAFCTARGI